MEIGEIIKEAQPKEYSKLKKNKKKKHSKQQKLTERDYENLMKHSSYKRCSGGAIRQVR